MVQVTRKQPVPSTRMHTSSTASNTVQMVMCETLDESRPDPKKLTQMLSVRP